MDIDDEIKSLKERRFFRTPHQPFGHGLCPRCNQPKYIYKERIDDAGNIEVVEDMFCGKCTVHLLKMWGLKRR